ncbi:MAG: hypothetical protein WC600_02580 [Desulfobaccales bacterium]
MLHFRKKIGIFSLFLAFLLAVPGFAETLEAPSGKVIVFKTEDLMDYAIKHISEKKEPSDPLFLQTIAALVDNGTQCSVIKSGSSRLSYRRKVRILNGRSRGAVGWVNGEFVK